MKRIISLLSVVFWLVGAGVVLADDTDVYGTSTVSVEPNVLIIFDTSGSMGTKDVPGEYYNPATTYSGTYTNAVVYQRTKKKGKYIYTAFVSDVSLLNCPTATTALQTDGYVSTAVRGATGNYECGGTEIYLVMGNWLNYNASGLGALKTRIEVAKEVITNLINETDNVRFGLMRFNDNQGGRVVQYISPSTTKSTLTTAVAGLSASGWTPLAETLAEAGLYYAGKRSWFNTGVSYTSPIEYTCQKNYIILMTDGQPTYDNDSKLATGNYINGDHIGDQDGDGHDSGASAIYYASYGSDYLDDVAYYLYNNDLSASLGVAGEAFERQNVITHTIGFQTAQQLLEDTATNGGGNYYTANSISGLAAAFDEILGSIADVNGVFVAPVVPVSRMNRTFAGNNIYIGFFKPEIEGRWFGNIKKYSLGQSGELLDANGNEATLPNGEIKDNAQSFWSTTPDGPDVLKGGLGGLLLDQASRNLYTYLGTNTVLTHATNAFAIANTDLTETHLAVGNALARETVIKDIHGVGRDWIMGDILHSEPAIIHYDNNTTVIFAGSNDGMMHCFEESTGAELWGFIPPEQLGRLKQLSDYNTDHDYFTDGTPKVYTNTTSGQKILFFGERRGGNCYYAIDVTDYNAPVWLYKTSSTILGAGAEILGQSWGNLIPMKMQTTSGVETVVLLPGGYDINQDLDTPAASDSVGRAVLALKVSDGSVANFSFNAGNYADMTHCVVDLSGLDTDGDTIINRIYAPDLKGQMFAFEDDDLNGTWTNRRLFSASEGLVHRKIFYAPDATTYTFKPSATETKLADMIFFGTGDRENPTDTTVVNRFYAVENDWTTASANLTEANLYDATDNFIQMGTDAQKLAAQNALDHPDTHGWFIELENPGEKMIAAPIVYNTVVYFTTFTPDTSTVSGTDPCAAAGSSGTARLYALNYLTGAAVLDYSDETETDGGGNTVVRGKKDRSKIIGTSIPSAPVIAILESGAELYIGVQGGVLNDDVLMKADMHMYYWREVN